MRYSVSMNDFPKDSLMNSLLRDKLIDKLTIRVFGLDSFLGPSSKEHLEMLTYTVKDKWSLPFDIFCFDLNCSEYYNNKYPILIEPAATYSLIPYEYMELIKNKYFNEEFKTGKCYYKYDYDYLGKIFRIKCEDLKKIKMVMLYNKRYSIIYDLY